MKSKTAQATFVVPRPIGRSQADFVAKVLRGENYGKQLELFRETLTPRARLQVYAMMSLADPKQLDKRNYAKVIDIARAMGYEPNEKTGQLPSNVFQDIEEVGIRLRRKEIEIFFHEPKGRAANGRLLFRDFSVNLSILQSFGFLYEDEDGQPIDLEEKSENDLIKYEPIDGGESLYALPMIDEKGKPIMDEKGNIRRRRANGVHWRFNSELAERAKHSETSWIMFAESLKILAKYVGQPAAFNLIEKTLFHKGTNIEYGHDRLVAHLGITSKDQNQVEKAIDAAFQIALAEGIIDNPVIIRPEKYYKPTKKTGKRRRTGMVYQWIPAKRWRVGKNLPSLLSEDKNSGMME